MMRSKIISARLKIPICLLCVFLFAGCAVIGMSGTSDLNPQFVTPYLSRSELPDSGVLVPPPPGKNSGAMALDNEVNAKSQKLRGTARWELAIKDANLKFPEGAQAFSCALNAPITQEETPHLYILMRRSLYDAGLATFAAKGKYDRKRPFVVKKQPICVPDQKESLAHNGSYPSGHTAIGWAWALILAEIAPERTDAILARGREFGESRVVCNVHWESDVIWGRFIGAATVARLHADPTFRADIQAARKELESVWKKELKPTCDCEAEGKALQIKY